MTVRVGINGFGRIGRNLFRAAMQRGADLDFVAVNDLGSLDTMAHLLKYDSILGTLPQKITASKNGIKVGDDELRVLSERNPADLPWKELDVDVVVEATGLFTSRAKAAAHLDAGAPLVVVSAPSDGADGTFVVASTTRTSTRSHRRSCPAPAARPTASIHRGQPFRHRRSSLSHGLGQILNSEQFVQIDRAISIGISSIDMHETHGEERQPCAQYDFALHGKIFEVHVFDLRRILDLDQAPAASLPLRGGDTLQYIRANQHSSM